MNRFRGTVITLLLSASASFIEDERQVGKKAEAELFQFRHLAVGKEAPQIEGDDQDGKRFKLSDYRGKVVLIDFWNYM